jgi:hypothetical protein
MSTLGSPSLISGAVKLGDSLKSSWQRAGERGKAIGSNPQAMRSMSDSYFKQGLEGLQTAGFGGGAAAVGKETIEGVAGAVERRAATKFAAKSAEDQARKIVQAVNPAHSEWRGALRNLLQGGLNNVREYAVKNGLPLRSNLEFSKAARGAADEAQAFYKSKILGPIKDTIIEIPRDSGVARIPTEGGTSSRATLEAVDARIAQINDMLRSKFGKSQIGQAREALANEHELVAERSGLAERMYKAIGDRLKINPQAIRALKQQFGSLYGLADQIEDAVTRRASAEASRAEGIRLPHSVTQLAMSGLNKLRGGPSAIADRELAKWLTRSTL